MGPEFDSRSNVDRTDDDRRAELVAAAAEVSNELPGEQSVNVVSLDRTTGNAAVVVSHRPEPGGEDYVRRALDHVQRIGRVLGLRANQPPEFLADPNVQRTSSGGAAVHLRQQLKGIPIYEASEVVRFDPEGRLTEVAGRSHTVGRDLSTATSVDAVAAVVAAARWLAEQEPEEEARDPYGGSLRAPRLELGDLAPTVVSVDVSHPERATVLDAPPFVSPTTARLVWFPGDEDLRLAWQVFLQSPAGAQHRVIVDANDATVLLHRLLNRSLTATADVFLQGGGSPRESVDLPIPVTRFGLPEPVLPGGHPDPWVLDGSTVGANVAAVIADTGEPVEGVQSSGRVRFSAGPDSDDQLVVNLFVLNGIMHDVFYALGFREPDGNFQHDNFGRGGLGSDRVRALVHPGPVWGTANMGTPPEGLAPTMNMGLVESTDRHTALDPDVVFHEFTHGVTNRLVGGPQDTTALDAPQSGGMGEGWGDYVACVLNGRDTVGSWVVDHPLGIRRHAYDDDFPGTFADLGSADYSEVHDIGELWCAVLLDMTRRVGAPLGMQLVVDALKLSAANPGFLAMRDAILVAARDLATARNMSDVEAETLTSNLWDAFAAFGMGPNATSVEATLGPVTADFNGPPRTTTGPTVSRTVAAGLTVPDNDPGGVVSTAVVDAGGVVRALRVAVDISTTYRGDLTVRLRAPDGRVVTLHDRAGGSADDLRATWESGPESPLAELIGMPVQGTWALLVADEAPADTAVLEEWTLTAELADARPTASASSSPGLAVPDDDAEGVSAELDLAGAGTISHLVVEIDLTHTWIGDLDVRLFGPSGASAVLHDNEGDDADNLIQTFDSDDEGSPLGAFLGLPVTGTWRLHVADNARRDVGKLNRWAITADL
jgi:extracellular elastinolytic metalloproteinase